MYILGSVRICLAIQEINKTESLSSRGHNNLRHFKNLTGPCPPEGQDPPAPTNGQEQVPSTRKPAEASKTASFTKGDSRSKNHNSAACRIETTTTES